MELTPSGDTCSGPAGPNTYKDSFDRPWYTAVKRNPPETVIAPALNLDIPSYGIIFLTPPEDAKVDAAVRGIHEPEFDHVLTGTFEITLPEHLESIQYETIRVGVKCVAKLDMGVARGIEEDEMFRREMEFEEDDVGKFVQGSLIVSNRAMLLQHLCHKRVRRSWM